MSKPLICLAAIVGNEADIIERFIRSFEPAVDSMVFVQAVGKQEADETMCIAEKICGELEIPLVSQVYFNREDWPHVDSFCAARAQSWKRAGQTGADYLLWADADDLLKEGSADLLREAAQSGKSDVYIVPYEVRGKSQIIYRERLVRNDGCSFWRFPVHELMGFKREATYTALKGAAVVHAPLPDKKRIEGRNRTILEHAIQDGARHLFFLSQEALESGQPELFHKYAMAALAHPGLDVVERYEIFINLAQNEPDTANGQEKAKTHAARAFDLLPDRREALALLACFALVDGRKEEAFQLAKLMASIPIPKKAYWTLNRDWYTWKGFYLLTQTMRGVGKEEEALKLEQEQFEKNGALFSICHPTYLRPEQALAVRELYLGAADNPMAVEYIFGIHHDDKKSLALLSGYRHTVTDKEGCCPNTHEALKASKGKFIMVVADDLLPPQGWDTQIGKALADNNANGFGGENQHVVLNFNDCLRTDGHLNHAFMTRPWLETLLADPWPGTGIYSDDEFTHRARKAGVVLDAPEIIFEHRHYSTGKVPIDATYEDQNQVKNYEDGRKILLERNPDIKVGFFTFDQAVADLMEKKGAKNIRFIQIGAHDGKTFDPIWPYVGKHAWSGILVEPQPRMYDRLLVEHGLNSKVALENVAIGREAGEGKMYVFKESPTLPYHATMLASIDRDALVHNGHGYKGEIEEMTVPVMTFHGLLEKHGVSEAEILQIDTEGYDYEILKMMGETKLRPALIHYEHGMLSPTNQHECEQFLAGLGYSVTRVGIDTVAVER